MRKRITSLLLTLVMLLSLVPAMGVTASAADDTYGYGNIKDWSGFKSYLSSPTSRDLTLEMTSIIRRDMMMMRSL